MMVEREKECHSGLRERRNVKVREERCHGGGERKDLMVVEREVECYGEKRGVMPWRGGERNLSWWR